MLLKGLIVFFVFLLIVAICALIYLLLKNKDHQVLARGLEAESEEEITIEKLEELASDKTLSKNELFELIQIFGEKFICEISLLVILHSKVGVKSSLF